MFNMLTAKVKNLDVFDIGLIKLTLLFVGILIVKIFPRLMHIRYSILLCIIVVLAIRPTYRFFWGK